MRVRVLFFGVLRDLVGRSAEEAEFPPGSSLRSLLESYAEQYPAVKAMASSILVARNRSFAEATAPMEEGDEIALLPPVSGGSGAAEAAGPAVLCELTRAPIDVRKLGARLMTGAEGAVVTFEGTARNNTKGRATRFLDYECYEPLALKTMERIAREAAAAHEAGRIAIVHRLGRLLIGETSVAVVVTAPHRRPAFQAALECIDRLKKMVPIWKKEYFVDGEIWAEGEWDYDAAR